MSGNRAEAARASTLSEPVEEGEAPARERLAAPLLGEHADIVMVELDEPGAERDGGQVEVRGTSGAPNSGAPTDAKCGTERGQMTAAANNPLFFNSL